MGIGIGTGACVSRLETCLFARETSVYVVSESEDASWERAILDDGENSTGGRNVGQGWLDV